MRGEAVMTISSRKLLQLVERHESGQIMESDLDAFLEQPTLWRNIPQAATQTTEASPQLILTPDTSQAFWQGAWDELGVKITVPPLPKLTSKQAKSLERFGFMLMYLPPVTEDQYPEGFVKPAWSEHLDASKIERKPLIGQWVAIETIAKPHWDDKNGYPEDRLMSAVKHDKRFFTSHDALTGGLLAQIAKVTGFPRKGTRLPTAEEWNLVGNLFNWMRDHCSMPLPDLGSTGSWEWCANVYDSEGRLHVGCSDRGGLADVLAGRRGRSYDPLAFRVLAVL